MLKNELYASLELQITMAQDYSEWLKQETKRNKLLVSGLEELAILTALGIGAEVRVDAADFAGS